MHGALARHKREIRVHHSVCFPLNKMEQIQTNSQFDDQTAYNFTAGIRPVHSQAAGAGQQSVSSLFGPPELTLFNPLRRGSEALRVH